MGKRQRSRDRKAANSANRRSMPASSTSTPGTGTDRHSPRLRPQPYGPPDATEELWYVWQRVYDHESDSWDELACTGFIGADQPTAQANAMEAFLQDSPAAQRSLISWDLPGEELLYQKAETGFYISQIGFNAD
jgi:hypothetical protein